MWKSSTGRVVGRGIALLAVAACSQPDIRIDAVGDCGVQIDVAGQPRCAVPCRLGSSSGESVLATPVVEDDGCQFLGWEGACAGVGPCELGPGDSATVTTARVAWPLVIEVVPPRAGSVLTRPALAACDDVCRALVPVGSKVDLLASAHRGWRFLGWGGSCPAQTASCSLQPSAPVAVTAQFAAAPTAHVTVAVSGEGSVSSSDGLIQCPGRCQVEVPVGASVELTATADRRSRFAGWAGGCVGQAGTCLMTIIGDVTVEAAFPRVYGPVTVLDPNIRLGAVASDSQGAIYLAGEVTGPAVLAGQVVPFVTTGLPHGNPFVAKLTAANQLVWLSVAGNSTTGGRGWVNRLAVDAAGRVAATFMGSGPPQVWQGLTASGTNGCTYFALHQPDGGLTTFWGAPGSSIPTSAAATPAGFVIGGHFGSAMSAAGKSATGPTAYLNNGYVIDIDEAGSVRNVWPVAAAQGSWVTNPQLLSRGADAVLVGASSQGFMDLGCGTYPPSAVPRTWEQNYWAALSARSSGGTCSAATYLEAGVDSSVFIERLAEVGTDVLVLLRFRGSITGAGVALASSAQPPFSAADVDEQHDMAILRLDPVGAPLWQSHLRPLLPSARSAVSWGWTGQLAVTQVDGADRLMVADLTNTSVMAGGLATPCGRGVAAYDSFAYVFDALSGAPVWSACWGGAGSVPPAASIAATPGGFLVGLHMDSTGQVAGEALVPGGGPGNLRSAYFVLYPP